MHDNVAESALASNRMQRSWAEAMLDRYLTAPDESVWVTDPIASRLKDQASPELRQIFCALPPKLRANENGSKAR